MTIGMTAALATSTPDPASSGGTWRRTPDPATVLPFRSGLATEVLEHDPAAVVLDEENTTVDCVGLVTILRDLGYLGKILILSPALGPGHLRAAIRTGADGYLARSAAGRRLAPSLDAMIDGHYAISPDLAAQALRAEPCPLSSRELAVLGMVAKHWPTDQIAGSLGLTTGSTRNVISSLTRRLGAHTRDEAAAQARTSGWI
ncbi:LuxR C-terminal-related transcriptional regulator [Acidipropionibacterium acidipropionici]|uniref:LuxR C-terminal-related transcriptional regulator n=1 Tax=Acidipropionibacterium acidipropionici TaxID=1748 RepID=UPI0012FDCDA4|nr:LuxR C-terminal-related transcriptional regulator [Acidipropionibacterium acidipropionici]